MRCNSNGLLHVPSKRKEEIKSGTSGCGSFVVAYFQPATSIDRLHMHVRTHAHIHTMFQFIWQLLDLELKGLSALKTVLMQHIF